MKKLVNTTLLVLALAIPAAAQDSLTNITYQIGAPLGDTKDFIDKTSFRGVGFEIRSFVGDGNLSVGGGIAWNVFDSGAVSDTISIRTDAINGDITGTQFRYINSVPIMGQIFYHLGDPGATHAYVGTGVGLYYIEQRFEIGLLATEVNNWHFGLAPEAGVMIPISDSARFNLAARYNYAFESGTDLSGDKRGYDYFTFNIGIAFFSGIF